MNKVVTVNLGGNAYQLEEGGYESLRSYLERARQNLAANPDRDEIVADIERAIADKFRLTLSPHKTVVLGADVDRIVAEMGPVDGGVEGTAVPGVATPPPASSSASAATGAGPKRLYLIREGSMLGGVCTGLAAYFAVDVSLIRILFVCLTLAFGIGVHFPVACLLGLLIYVALMLVVPTATTPEERAAASGMPFDTARDFIRRAKDGYYEGMKTLRNSQARHEWQQKFRREMRGWKRQMRREWRGDPVYVYHKHFLVSIAESLLTIAVIIVVAVVADHHSSHFHRILTEIPQDLRHAADAFRDWWQRR